MHDATAAQALLRVAEMYALMARRAAEREREADPLAFAYG
jgi:hypothetical protein